MTATKTPIAAASTSLEIFPFEGIEYGFPATTMSATKKLQFLPTAPVSLLFCSLIPGHWTGYGFPRHPRTLHDPTLPSSALSDRLGSCYGVC